jgi:hypothetical protein
MPLELTRSWNFIFVKVQFFLGWNVVILKLLV